MSDVIDPIDPMSGDDFESWFNAVVEQDQRLVGVSRAWKSTAAIADPHAPTCGRCNIKMTIKSNHTTGDKFYGCPNYGRTKCKSIPLKATSYGRTVMHERNGQAVYGDYSNSFYCEDFDSAGDMYDLIHHDIGCKD